MTKMKHLNLKQVSQKTLIYKKKLFIDSVENWYLDPGDLFGTPRLDPVNLRSDPNRNFFSLNQYNFKKKWNEKKEEYSPGYTLLSSA